MKKPEQEQCCGCGCGFRTTIQPLFKLNQMVEQAERRAKEQAESKDNQKETEK